MSSDGGVTGRRAFYQPHGSRKELKYGEVISVTPEEGPFLLSLSLSSHSLS